MELPVRENGEIAKPSQHRVYKLQEGPLLETIRALMGNPTVRQKVMTFRRSFSLAMNARKLTVDCALKHTEVII